MTCRPSAGSSSKRDLKTKDVSGVYDNDTHSGSDNDKEHRQTTQKTRHQKHYQWLDQVHMMPHHQILTHLGSATPPRKGDNHNTSPTTVHRSPLLSNRMLPLHAFCLHQAVPDTHYSTNDHWSLTREISWFAPFIKYKPIIY